MGGCRPIWIWGKGAGSIGVEVAGVTLVVKIRMTEYWHWKTLASFNGVSRGWSIYSQDLDMLLECVGISRDTIESKMLREGHNAIKIIYDPTKMWLSMGNELDI